MTKKIGGIIMRQVAGEQCVCGKSHADCARDWDARLGITTNAADSYFENLAKIRKAASDGLDPYCINATREAAGYVSHWTPKMESDSLAVPIHTALDTGADSDSHTGGVSNGTASGGNRNRRKRGSGKTTGGSGRRGRGKSIRRKR